MSDRRLSKKYVYCSHRQGYCVQVNPSPPRVRRNALFWTANHAIVYTDEQKPRSKERQWSDQRNRQFGNRIKGC